MIASQPFLAGSLKQAPRNSVVRAQLADMILVNTGVSGKERIHRRRAVSTALSSGSTGSGAGGKGGSMDRWSRTFLASSLFENTEKYVSFSLLFIFNHVILHIYGNRKNVNFEIDCLIEGCLAGETSLIVLDTLEAFIQAVKALEEHDVMQATLPRSLEVLLHLLACNESVSIMEHTFATQRSIVVKVKQNILVFTYF